MARSVGSGYSPKLPGSTSGDKKINAPRRNAPLTRTVPLRVLATSDLHMQVTCFDYVKDCPSVGGSVAKLASLIHDARSEIDQRNGICLLLDNGDTFQGNPMADVLASSTDFATHPMIAAINTLKYDAVGLGNHDFDFGLPFLSAGLSMLECPIVCSNFRAAALPMINPSLIVERKAKASDGTEVLIKIGIIGSLPDKTLVWSRHHLQNRAEVTHPLKTLGQTAKDLRQKGATVVVALTHMGLALVDEGPEAQNMVAEVADIPEIDVVIAGHTHLRFPSHDHLSVPNADLEQGTVNGTPVVQPGASASDLGVVDLELLETDTGWTVTTAKAKLTEVSKDTPEDPAIVSHCAPAHDATRKFLAEPTGNISAPMHSFFALADPSPVPALLAAAKRQAITSALRGTEYAGLPLVTAASAPLTGGFDGPENFLLLQKGVIARRHIAGMNPYSNQVWAVKTNGARILDWLERSAVIFNTLSAGDPDQLLINPSVPGFRFDTIYGLSYELDPRLPPRIDASGQVVPDSAGRVRDVRWQGEPLHKDMEFIVATTDHRAGGGGLYQMFENAEIIVQGHAPLQQAMLHYLRAPDCSEVRSSKPWSFAPDMGLSAILLTAPEAAYYLTDIAHLKPDICGINDDGFLRLRLHL